MSFDEIEAPPAWRCVDFISDLHLQESEPANFLAWQNYMAHSPADAVFILGDLFEVWVGDDVLAVEASPSFEDSCCRVLSRCAQQRKLYFMRGNRDFLVSEAFARACALQLLDDFSVLSFGGQRYLLSHGDALCLADEPYQAFRAQVRSASWQADFLATPLLARLEQARAMRAASELRKQQQQAAGAAWVDVDCEAAVKWMDIARARHFIHGHTHEGRDHAITSAQGQGIRHVLPDWSVADEPSRGYALRLRLDDSGAVIAQHVAVI